MAHPLPRRRTPIESRDPRSDRPPRFLPALPDDTSQKRRRASQSSSSSTSSEPHHDDDNDSLGMLQVNDSQSSLSPSVSDSDTLQYTRSQQSFTCHFPQAPIQRIPPEVHLCILAKLTSTHDLYSCIQVSKLWARNAVALLWQRPNLNRPRNIDTVIKACQDPNKLFQYPELIRRVNLSTQGAAVGDDVPMALSQCERIERLTLTGCRSLSDNGLIPLLQGNKNLIALDVTLVDRLTDKTLLLVAENSRRLQGLSVAGCHDLTDASISALAKNCRLLKRLKLADCRKVTDASVMTLAQHCSTLLEIDLGGLETLQPLTVSTMLSMCRNLRELRMQHCQSIDHSAFASLRSSTSRFNSLRVLDLTNCLEIDDRAVDRIVTTCTRLRNLVLAKCRNLTNNAVYSITKLGKVLHYVHLGHCVSLTDDAIIALARACTRIRYIDLASCSLLTNRSVSQLAANLPKLKRVGLVKCHLITDPGVIALSTLGIKTTRGRHGIVMENALERVHLSYCTRLTPMSIQLLLNNCPKLTHLSLTGVGPFLREEVQAFCRQPPADFNEHQRNHFCVFSNGVTHAGVSLLRDYLNSPDSSIMFPHFLRERLPSVTDMVGQTQHEQIMLDNIEMGDEEVLDDGGSPQGDANDMSMDINEDYMQVPEGTIEHGNTTMFPVQQAHASGHGSVMMAYEEAGGMPFVDPLHEPAWTGGSAGPPSVYATAHGSPSNSTSHVTGMLGAAVLEDAASPSGGSR